MKAVLWNVEWATPNSPRGRAITARIAERAPDVVCLTEATIPALGWEGHFVESEPDYGYSHDGERRKVLMWSATPWSEVDAFGDPELPPGRFVSAINGGIRFVAVCIPWRDAHVRSGRRDREPWQDHLAYLRGLRGILNRLAESGAPICLLGDFNQRVPRRGQPEEVWVALRAAVDNRTVITEGMTDGDGASLIDHVAIGAGLGGSVTTILARSADRVRLSDHPGVVRGVAGPRSIASASARPEVVRRFPPQPLWGVGTSPRSAREPIAGVLDRHGCDPIQTVAVVSSAELFVVTITRAI